MDKKRKDWDLSTLRGAMGLMAHAHDGQFDLAGTDYFNHPMEVMVKLEKHRRLVFLLGLNFTHLRILALLHDVLEDTDYEIEDLVEMNLPQELVEPLVALKHERFEPTEVYYADVVKDIRAILVKMCDLEHNMDLTRFDCEITSTITERVKKYQKWELFLRTALNEYITDYKNHVAYVGKM